ncbi:hypothetical protein WH47_06238 [Habropoda laboriosa]|uniref:Uncharacterized protein n=1 Tax=Habropoda laboriosa TaxID=597456 RepID=A0A0L7RJP3_9HYME|nr:PREDICTED: uncharacterized protein LOC108578268 [Habropoda laboriosa]XP_017797132.1 PREDICTED: uncharacterized protein LOC108578268 [Habropoda laboriosa]KOC71177.1 hypothetical protein WH47_06238 [Habropoda laboriosa]
MASSDSSGVKPMTISGRLSSERERLIGMTDDERAFRARYLKSLELAPEEPITPEGLYKETYNPFRRFYRVPLNKFEAALKPILGATAASIARLTTARLLMTIVGIYGGWYYYKYNTATWMKHTGWRVIYTRDAEYPCEKDYPGLVKPKTWATDKFENSPI